MTDYMSYNVPPDKSNPNPKNNGGARVRQRAHQSPGKGRHPLGQNRPEFSQHAPNLMDPHRTFHFDASQSLCAAKAVLAQRLHSHEALGGATASQVASAVFASFLPLFP